MRRTVSEKKRKRLVALERAVGVTMQDGAWNALVRLSVDELACVEVWVNATRLPKPVESATAMGHE